MRVVRFYKKGKGRGCRRRRWSSSSLICPVSYSLVGDDDKVCEEGIVSAKVFTGYKRSVKFTVKMT